MNTSTFTRRRAAVLEKMRAQGGGVAIIPTAPEVMRNADADYPYRHDSYFYYLTGFPEPEATLVLIAGERDQAILFCREKNEEREIWDGYRYGPAGAKEKFGFDAAFAIGNIDSELPMLMANAPALFYALGSSARLDAQVQGWLNAVRAQARAGVTAPAAAVQPGIFARLYHRDGKDGYLNDIPLVMEYTRKTAYRYKEFAPLVKLLDALDENRTGVGFTF